LIFKSIDTVGGLEQYVSELAITLNAPVYAPLQTTPLPMAASGTRPEVIGFRESGWFRDIFDHLPGGAVVSTLEYEAFEVPAKHDIVITVGEATKAVIHHPHQRRIHLLNMPPRWLFDLAPGRYDDIPQPVRWIMQLYQSLVRVHDVSTISRIDEFVVPSETIDRRLETYYDRTADRIIYPPINTAEYYFESNDGFLLYVGRLTAAKRILEIVEALSGTDYRLKVAGTGPQENAVRKAADRNVEILGYVSDDYKRELLANCDALVFNSDREAFGIVPVEAMASGKPVVGIDEGFTQYQIRDGENGVLFSRGPENLIAAIEQMYEAEWDPEEIQQNAKRYDVEGLKKG
jgi:glycosyltransferase involved in cell wall biosynthesis